MTKRHVLSLLCDDSLGLLGTARGLGPYIPLRSSKQLIPIDVLTNTVPNTRSCPKKCQKHTKEITHFQESLAPRNSSNPLTALVSETDLDGDVVHHTPAFLGASAVHPRNRMWVGSPQL